jgi:uncharacterized Tic20 family protein
MVRACAAFRKRGWRELKRESAVVSRMVPAVLGPVLLWATRREEEAAGAREDV